MIKDNLPFINGLNERNVIESLKEDGVILVKCPKCGSYHIVRNGHYTRKIAYIEGESSFFRVQKYLCRHCKSSFKQLPYFISSYNHYSNISLLKILVEEGSFKFVSKVLNVSRSTVRSIRKRFSSDLKRLVVLTKKYVLNSFEELYKMYLKEFQLFLFDLSTETDTEQRLVFHLSYVCGG